MDLNEIRLYIAQLESEMADLRSSVQDMEARNDAALVAPWETIPAWFQLFDLYDVKKTTLKVRGFDTASDEVVCVAGVHLAVTGGGVELDTAITISANTYIYLNVTRGSPSTATLETTATYADGDDDEERFYIWYIPWDTNHIDIYNITDLRYTPHITGMAGT